MFLIVSTYRPVVQARGSRVWAQIHAKLFSSPALNSHLTSSGCDEKTPVMSDFESDTVLLFSIPTYTRLDRKHCHLPILPVLWYNGHLITRFHCKASFPNHSNAHGVGLCCFLMLAFVSAGALNPPRALPNVQLFPYKAAG